MKKIIVLLASSVVLFAGAAYAGEGCLYGKSNEFAKIDPAAEQEITDPKLLAMLKEQADDAKEVLQPVHN